MVDPGRVLAAQIEASLGPVLQGLLSADPPSAAPCAAAAVLCGQQSVGDVFSVLCLLTSAQSPLFDRIKVFLAEPAARKAPKDPFTQVLTLVTAVINQQLRALLASVDARPAASGGAGSSAGDTSVILESLKVLSMICGRALVLGRHIPAPRDESLRVAEMPAAGLALLLLRCEALKLRVLLAGIEGRLPGPVLDSFTSLCPFLPSRLFCAIKPGTTIPNSPANHPLGPRAFGPVLLELDSLLERCCTGLALPRCCEVGRNAVITPEDRFLAVGPAAVFPGVPIDEPLRDKILFPVTESLALVTPFLLLTAARHGITAPFLASPLGTAATFESLEHCLRSLERRDSTPDALRRCMEAYAFVPDKVNILLMVRDCLAEAITARCAAPPAAPPKASHSVAIQPCMGEDYPVRRLLGLDHRSAARAAGLLLEALLLSSRLSFVPADALAEPVDMADAALRVREVLGSLSIQACNTLLLGVAPPHILAEEFHGWMGPLCDPLFLVGPPATAGLSRAHTEANELHVQNLVVWSLAEGMLAWLDPSLRRGILKMARRSGEAPNSPDFALRRRAVIRVMRGQLDSPTQGRDFSRALGLWASQFGPREERVQNAVWRRPGSPALNLVRSLGDLASYENRSSIINFSAFVNSLATAGEALDDLRRLPSPESRCWRLFTDKTLAGEISRQGPRAIENMQRYAADLPPTLSALLPLCAYVASLGRTILLALQSPEAAAAAPNERRLMRKVGSIRAGRTEGSFQVDSTTRAVHVEKTVFVLMSLNKWRRDLAKVSRHLREVVLAAVEATEDARAVGGGAAALGLAMQVYDQSQGQAARAPAAAPPRSTFARSRAASVAAADAVNDGLVVGTAAIRTREVDGRNRAEVEGAMSQVRRGGLELFS